MNMSTTAEYLANGAEAAGAQARAAGEQVDETLRRKAGQLQKFFDDIEELLRRVSDLGDRDIARLRARLESSIESVKEATRGGAQAAIDSTRRAAEATDGYVHRNPWTAIGAGAAIGVLLGALLSRK
jgi:ElaB/YqjD/DUF883 family membrane-anchored ribosome-binding protein